jgi:hypothetical protein
MSAHTNRLRKHAADLHIIAKADSKAKKAIFQKAQGSLVRAICDCAQQLLSGEVPLRQQEVTRLRRHRATLQQLGAKAPIASKRALLKKGGNAAGALGALMRTVVRPVEKTFRNITRPVREVLSAARRVKPAELQPTARRLLKQLLATKQKSSAKGKVKPKT